MRFENKIQYLFFIESENETLFFHIRIKQPKNKDEINKTNDRRGPGREYTLC